MILSWKVRIAFLILHISRLKKRQHFGFSGFNRKGLNMSKKIAALWLTGFKAISLHLLTINKLLCYYASMIKSTA